MELNKNMPKNDIGTIIKKLSFELAIISLVTVLFGLAFFLTINLRTASRQSSLKQHRSISALLFTHKKSGLILPADANYIDSWMTFRYINVIFDLPENYLKDDLNIHDNNYPNVSLKKCALTDKIDPALFLDKVKQAVNAYLETKARQE